VEDTEEEGEEGGERFLGEEEKSKHGEQNLKGVFVRSQYSGVVQTYLSHEVYDEMGI
jgi:hypothetical protein